MLYSNFFSKFFFIVLLNFLWAYSATAVVQGNPQVSLSTNQEDYFIGDDFVLSIHLQRGTQNNEIDGWLWVHLPDGSTAFLHPDFTFGRIPGGSGPVVENFTVVDFSGPILQLSVPSFLSAGTYTFFAAGYDPDSPISSDDRITNTAVISVNLNRNDEIVDGVVIESETLINDSSALCKIRVRARNITSQLKAGVLYYYAFDAGGVLISLTTISGLIPPNATAILEGTWISPPIVNCSEIATFELDSGFSYFLP